MMKKTTSQSMAVSDEEKAAIEVIALAERMKPGTFVREIFFRGLSGYLEDREVHAPARNEEIYVRLIKLIESDEELRRMKEVVEYRTGLMDEARKLAAEETKDEPAGMRVPTRNNIVNAGGASTKKKRA